MAATISSCSSARSRRAARDAAGADERVDAGDSSTLHAFGAADTPMVVTYHPAYLLRTPADKRKAWEDLKFARATFARITGGGNA